VPDSLTVSATLVVNDGERELAVAVKAGSWLIDSDDLESAIGWDLRPEGLCRGDVCVPVRDQSSLMVGDALSLNQVAKALGRSFAAETDPPMAVLGSADTAAKLTTAKAPNFSLADINGNQVSLDDYAGRKRLLLAWSSW